MTDYDKIKYLEKRMGVENILIGNVLQYFREKQNLFYPMLMKKLNKNDEFFQVSWDELKIVQDFIDKVGLGIVDIDDSGDYIYISKRDLSEIVDARDGSLDRFIGEQGYECIDFIYKLVSSDEK